jgi:hypothetical protein
MMPAILCGAALLLLFGWLRQRSFSNRLQRLKEAADQAHAEAFSRPSNKAEGGEA